MCTVLRTYSVRRARVDHEHCMLCGWMIYAGEAYDAVVMVAQGYLFVVKEHSDCPHDPIWDDDEDEGWDEGEISDISPQSEAPLPMAA